MSQEVNFPAQFLVEGGVRCKTLRQIAQHFLQLRIFDQQMNSPIRLHTREEFLRKVPRVPRKNRMIQMMRSQVSTLPRNLVGTRGLSPQFNWIVTNARECLSSQSKSLFPYSSIFASYTSFIPSMTVMPCIILLSAPVEAGLSSGSPLGTFSVISFPIVTSQQ